MDQRIRSRIPLLSPSNISRCRGGGKKKKRVNSSRVTIERADLHTCNDSMEESKRWKQRMNEKEEGEKRRTRREEKKREKERGGCSVVFILIAGRRLTTRREYIYTDAL